MSPSVFKRIRDKKRKGEREISINLRYPTPVASSVGKQIDRSYTETFALALFFSLHSFPANRTKSKNEVSKILSRYVATASTQKGRARRVFSR